MSIENTITFLILIILNILFYFGNFRIANFFKLMDIPDKVRKIHTTKVPLTGGFFLFFNILTIFLLKNYYNLTNVSISFKDHSNEGNQTQKIIWSLIPSLSSIAKVLIPTFWQCHVKDSSSS